LDALQKVLSVGHLQEAAEQWARKQAASREPADWAQNMLNNLKVDRLVGALSLYPGWLGWLGRPAESRPPGTGGTTAASPTSFLEPSIPQLVLDTSPG
jgi:hypothetical protein